MKPSKSSKKFTLPDKIVLGLNILISLALLLSYLAPVTDPRDLDFIAILGFGYLYLAFGSLIFIFYWIFRKRILILLSVLPFLAGIGILTHYVGFHGKTVQPQSPAQGAIRIMQYNVHKFEGLDRFLDMPIQDEVFDLVDSQQPDILTMVEFRKNGKETDTLLNLMKTKLKMNFYFQRFSTKRDSVGNIIFSKYPIVNSGLVDTSSSITRTRGIFADVSINKKTIRIYSLHLAAVTMNDKQKKRFLNGSLFSLEKLLFIKDRISAANVYRSFDVDVVKNHISTCPYPVVITGDFNDNPNSFAVHQLSDGLNNAFMEKASGFETTYYSFFPLQIDYIFASPQFRVLNYKTINNKMSDHRPVLSDLKIN